jgi:hypothetical protein
MRKQDRIRQEQNQDPSRQHSESEPMPRPTDRVKGSEDDEQRPPRQSGKLPLPE